MMRRRGRCRSTLALNRRAFTLLEVVLALGLSSLLLAALYTALQMHWSSSALGQVEMERSQVARALFRRIETDLRSVVFRDTALTSSTDDGSSSSSSGSTSGGSTSGGSTSGSTGSNSSSANSSGSSGSTGASSSSTSSSSGTSSSASAGTTSGTTTTTDTYSTQKTGLFGDSQMLIVHASLPTRAANVPAATTTGSSNSAVIGYSNSDMQSVAYFLAGSSSAFAQQLSGSLVGPSGQTTGLARMQGDRMAMQAADESGNLATMASNAQLLASEVASIQFEFFDGVSWTTSWDSATSNSLPNAVHITIDFLPPPSTGGWYSRPVSASTDRFRHTVALPLAQPYVPADSL